MGRLEDKVADIIRRKLRKADADLEVLPDGEVCGHVIAGEFKGRTYQARWHRLRDILQGELRPSEAIRMGTLLTYTPEEWFFGDEPHQWEFDRILRLGSGADSHLQFEKPKSGNCILDSVSRGVDDRNRIVIVV